MSFLARIADRAIAGAGRPVLQPKGGRVHRAPAEDDEPKVARAAASHDDPEEPAAQRAVAHREDDKPDAMRAKHRAADLPEEAEPPVAARAAAPHEEEPAVHRAVQDGKPEEEAPPARPLRRASVDGLKEPGEERHGEPALHRAAHDRTPEEEAPPARPLRRAPQGDMKEPAEDLHRAKAPSPAELSPENSPVPDDPGKDHPKPFLMALRRLEAGVPAQPSGGVGLAAPIIGEVSAAAPPDDYAAAQSPRGFAPEPFTPALERHDPFAAGSAAPSLRFGERPNVVIDRVDVLIQEPARAPRDGSAQAMSRAFRARYLRSL